MKPEILFLSRNYPPQIGGLEAYSCNLIKHVGRHHAVSKIVLGKPRKHLSWFIPYAMLKAVHVIKEEDICRVHVCDGLLATVGLLLKSFLPVTVSVTVHGLDITFKNGLYQAIIPHCVARLDKIICVSRHTRNECVQRGIPAAKTWVIPNGINPADFQISESRKACRIELGDKLGMRLEGRKILITVGRLVPRKGVAWFVENVMPELDPAITYLIAGHGEDQERIVHLIEEYKLQDRVKYLGTVSEKEKEILFSAADLFIQPNIPVEDDIEGFGLVVLEAGRYATYVVASDLEGLKDAITHGKNGVLIRPGDKELYIQQIEDLLSDHDVLMSKSLEAQNYVLSTYSWDNVAQQYVSVLEEQFGNNGCR